MSSGSAQPTVRDRIIRSLFSDKDESGTTLESYITHVRIYEDVQYPSQPPPEPTPAENLKERYILLSVKKNGRVRMHKSRANDNGTFQIGKTWNLDDLQKVQDTDRRGMIVTLLKPYYWTMESAKEKYMFVSALTKVYRKYTGGRMFEMIGFDQQHMPSIEQSQQDPNNNRTASSAISASSQLSNRPSTDVPQPRQERSISGQLPTTRRPSSSGPIAPLRTNRSVSEAPNQSIRLVPRQNSIASHEEPQERLMSPVRQSESAAVPRSRVTSSQYGGTDRDSVRSPFQSSNQSIPLTPRAVSQNMEVGPRRAVVPFASPPQSDVADLRRTEDDATRPRDPRSPPLIDARPLRHNSEQLGSPMSFKELRSPTSPIRERPPEKSLRRLVVDSPGLDLAPPLAQFEEPPISPMSPAPPAKSPARRPSNIRTSSTSSTKVLHDRLAGFTSPVGSTSHSPIPEVPPMIPMKSGARSADSPRLDRPDLPWQTPGDERSGGYFETQPTIPTKKPNTAIETSPQALHERTQLNDILSPVHVDTSSPTTLPSDDFELDDEAAYIDEAIKDFNWTSRSGADVLATQLQDELSALRAANIYALAENDERVQDILDKLDVGIAQCDEMSNLLTIYDFELATVSDHIKYIESQSQGLQVQTANQRALAEEIQNVLTSITISASDLDVLKGSQGNLESDTGISNIEKSLVNLYRALKSMDDENSDGQGMSAVRRKNQEYVQESDAFLSRLGKYLQIKFQAALLVKEADTVARFEPPQVLSGHEEGFMSLAPYSSFMLYARELNGNSHAEYMRKYAAAAKAAWREPVLDFAGQWRSLARKASVEENEMIFTAARDSQSTGTARSATLKRSNTLAKSIKSVTTSSNKTAQDGNESKMPASEVFRIIVDNLALLLTNEQNFLVSFFHLSTLDFQTFPDYISSSGRSAITIQSLDDHRRTEPNRTLAKERYILMESIFDWLGRDLFALVDHLAKLDPMQLFGIIQSLELVSAEWADSDQEYMLKLFQKLNDRLMSLLHNFIEAQVKAIRGIKITSKKRKGVIPVFEIFPDFVERVEMQLQQPSADVSVKNLHIRTTANDAYAQLSKAMFDSVRSLASSSTMTSQGTDFEDKEVLNYHILMIQNMHQSIEALQNRDNTILEDLQYRSQKHYAEHMSSYTRQVINRPIGRLIEFVVAFNRQIQADNNPTSKAAYSGATVKRLLTDHDERDLRKGIAAMWKRVDKHFGDEDGPATGLLPTVWKAVQQDYTDIIDRFLNIVHNRYPDIKVDWSKQNILGAFAKRDA